MASHNHDLQLLLPFEDTRAATTTDCCPACASSPAPFAPLTDGALRCRGRNVLLQREADGRLVPVLIQEPRRA